MREFWYDSDPVTDPVGASRGGDRVCRGGSSWRRAFDCRSAGRRESETTSNIGFRVAITDPPTEISTYDDLVEIPEGTFTMGDALNDYAFDGEETWNECERPTHDVYVSKFYIGKYEITNKSVAEVFQWAYEQGKITVSDSRVEYGDYTLLSLEGTVDIKFSDGEFVITDGKKYYACSGISWYGAVAYCNFRSEMEEEELCYDLSDWSCDFTKTGYRLPTEAEWEKAARGGLQGKRFPWGDTISHEQANYYSSSDYDYDTSSTEGYHPTYSTGSYPYTSPVGSFSPNDYGLYDMAGNVSEWCYDWFSSSYYTESPTSDPTGPSSGSYRVIRGGDWGSHGAWLCRVAYRSGGLPDVSHYYGFRVAKTAK